jgi:hypothetical protein
MGSVAACAATFLGSETRWERVLVKEIKEQIVKVLKEGVDNTNTDKFDEAIPYFDDILGLKEIMVQTFIQRGRSHWEMHRWELAAKDFKTALDLSPNNPDIEWTTCLMNLQRGNFTWYGLESRWKTRKFDSPRLKTPAPMWQRGKKFDRLFVWSEQGVGDQIIYLSMLPQLMKEGGKITVMCDARLIPLLERSFPGIEFVTQVAKIKGIDYHIPLGSIPSQYVYSYDDILHYRATNYLKPDPDRIKALRDELHDGRRLIGLSWASGAPRIGNHKTVALHELQPILSLPDTKFINLQYGNPYAEINEVEENTGCQVHVVPQVDNQNGFDDFAALIAACDQIVTVSNVTGHFAGAIGKPTLLLDSNKLWYWNNKRKHINLWYPTVKVFPKDNAIAPWTPQIEQLKQELTGQPVVRPTFVFFRTGEDKDLWYTRRFVRSLVDSNPGADIIMCTDSRTPEVEGVTRRFEYDSDSTDFMEYRLRIYAELRLEHPAIYLDDDMTVMENIDPAKLLEDKRVKFCARFYDTSHTFNPDIKGLNFDEHKGKTLGQVFPFLACATVTKDWTIWAELLNILDHIDPKYRKWYGDQEAMKIYTKTAEDWGELSEKDYACLPEYLTDQRVKIVHYKGARKEQMR